MNIRVLEIIAVQTDISLSEIADRLGVSYKTVQRAVADLKRVGVIERIGGRRKGYWKVKEENYFGICSITRSTQRSSPS